MRLLRSRAGQIVMPALLLFPTLMLFVYLIYETAKLSREKIRHQFAMDAAAFVEMANYSDFLNRTAYVNGAFPMRIFDEGYGDFNTECDGKTTNCVSNKSYASLLFENGAFPHLNGTYTPDHHAAEGDTQFQNLKQWKIEYTTSYNIHGGSCLTPGSNCQTDRTKMNEKQPPSLGGPFQLFSINDAAAYWHSYELAFEIYKLYYQVYSLLGSVEAAQFQVLQKLENQHQFLVKSYWLNTGDPDGSTLAGVFDSQMGGASSFDHALKVYCQPTYGYCGNEHVGGTGIEPIRPVCLNPAVQTFPNSAGCDGATPIPKQDSGLFQLVFVASPATITKMSRGLGLSMSWKYPTTNYFGVNWASVGGSAFPDGGAPMLHTTISIGNAPGMIPGVWPDPTPKFQVRQFP